MKVASHIANGTASVVESIVYMMLTLPHALGGYGFRNVEPNHRIALDADSHRRLRQSNCYVDYMFRGARIGWSAKNRTNAVSGANMLSRLALDYMSLQEHHTAEQQSRDAVRNCVLARMGIEVMQLFTYQLYEPLHFEVFMKNLFAKTGRRMQIRTARFDEMHAQLRALLPRQPRSSMPASPQNCGSPQ